MGTWNNIAIPRAVLVQASMVKTIKNRATPIAHAHYDTGTVVYINPTLMVPNIYTVYSYLSNIS